VIAVYQVQRDRLIPEIMRSCYFSNWRYIGGQRSGIMYVDLRTVNNFNTAHRKTSMNVTRFSIGFGWSTVLTTVNHTLRYVTLLLQEWSTFESNLVRYRPTMISSIRQPLYNEFVEVCFSFVVCVSCLFIFIINTPDLSCVYANYFVTVSTALTVLLTC